MSDDGVLRPDFTQPRDPNAPDIAVGSFRYGRRKPRCEHPQVVIDRHTLDVQCHCCEEFVNPGIVLLRIAEREMSLKWSQAEAARLRREVSELKAEAARVKAQLRRARRAIGPKEVA